MNSGTRGSRGADKLRALVWKRSDYRETSRLITLITRDRGKIVTLGKGAHRPNSQCLGRIDWLNLIEVKISGGNLPVLHRVRLLHEHRTLREPVRFHAANYLTELFDPAFVPGRPDEGLFDLLTGGLLLLERCPVATIPQILSGIELRFLAELGLRPPLLECSECGRGLAAGGLYLARSHPALVCRQHAAAGQRAVPAAVLRWLHQQASCAGRGWPALPPPPPGVAKLLGRWIGTAIDRPPRLRELAFQA